MKISIDVAQITGLAKNWRYKQSEDYFNKKGSLYELFLATNVDPLNIDGYLTPGKEWSDLDATDVAQITTAINNLVTDNRSNTNTIYGIGDNILYKITGSALNDVTNNSPSTPTWPRTIGSVVTGPRNDCLNSYVNIGGTQVYCLLYTYNIASGAGRMGRYDISNGSNWGTGNSSDTAYSLSTNDIANASGNLEVPRPMVLGTNRVMYIGSGRVVDQVDTAASSASPVLAALSIPADFEIQTLEWYKGLLVVGAHTKLAGVTRKGTVGIFFWNTRTSSSYEEPIFIPDDFCCSLFFDGEELWLTTSNGNFGKLRRWNGSIFEFVHELPTSPAGHHSMDKLREGIMIPVASQLFWYGRRKADLARELWQIGAVGTTLSCAKSIYPANDVVHLCGDSGGTKFIKTQASTYGATTIVFPMQEFPHRSRVAELTLHFPTLATGASLTAYYYKNFGSQVSIGNISYAVDGAVTYKKFKFPIMDVNQFTLYLSHDVSGVSNVVKVGRIELDVDPKDINT